MEPAGEERLLSPGVTGHRRRRPLDPMLLERLAETGFLATEFGLHEQAERIKNNKSNIKKTNHKKIEKE